MLDQIIASGPRPNTPITSHPSLAAARHGHTMLRQGNRGDGVSLIQQALIGVVSGLPLSTSGGTRRADGVFGPETLTAVRAFQKSARLVADGIVGPKTISMLADATKRAGLSSLVTGSELLLKSVTGLNGAPTSPSLNRERHALATTLSPFDTDTWRHPDVPRHYFAGGAAFAGGKAFGGRTTMAFAPAIPIITIAAEELVVLGIALIIAVASDEPPVPLPKPPVPKVPPATVGLTATALQVMMITTAALADAADGVAETIENIITSTALSNNNDPRCLEAIEKARTALRELRQAAQSTRHYVARGMAKWVRGKGYIIAPAIKRLTNAQIKAIKAMGAMGKACPLTSPGPPPAAPG